MSRSELKTVSKRHNYNLQHGTPYSSSAVRVNPQKEKTDIQLETRNSSSISCVAFQVFLSLKTLRVIKHKLLPCSIRTYSKHGNHIYIVQLNQNAGASGLKLVFSRIRVRCGEQEEI